jgi:hypothetical protein
MISAQSLLPRGIRAMRAGTLVGFRNTLASQGSVDIPVRSHGVCKLTRGQKCPRSTIRGLPRFGPADLPHSAPSDPAPLVAAVFLKPR